MLDGNSPRFPWKPSIAMLISRHAGTTVDSAFNRDTHARFLPGSVDDPSPGTTVSRAPIFAPPRRPEGPWVADMERPPVNRQGEAPVPIAGAGASCFVGTAEGERVVSDARSD